MSFIKINQTMRTLFRILFVCSLLSINIFFLQGQSSQNTVAIIPFSTSYNYDSDQPDYARMVAEIIQSAVVQTQRFTMVERLDLEKVLGIRQEKENDMKSEYEGWNGITDSKLVEVGKLLGIQYIFTGNLLSASSSITISGSYSAELSFTTKVISVESGKIYVTESFKIVSWKNPIAQNIGKNSTSEAFNAALVNAGEPIKQFIDKYFPLRVPFYKVKETNKQQEPTAIVIKGGISIGLRVGQYLDIVEKDTDPENPSYWDKIGEAKIIAIEGEYATCKIIKDGEIIKARISEQAKIFAQSRAYK